MGGFISDQKVFVANFLVKNGHFDFWVLQKELCFFWGELKIHPNTFPICADSKFVPQRFVLEWRDAFIESWEDFLGSESLAFSIFWHLPRNFPSHKNDDSKRLLAKKAILANGKQSPAKTRWANVCFKFKRATKTTRDGNYWHVRHLHLIKCKHCRCV